MPPHLMVQIVVLLCRLILYVFSNLVCERLGHGHTAAPEPGNGFVDRQKYRLNRRAFHAAEALVSWSDWARRSLIQDYGVDDARVRTIAPGKA